MGNGRLLRNFQQGSDLCDLLFRDRTLAGAWKDRLRGARRGQETGYEVNARIQVREGSRGSGDGGGAKLRHAAGLQETRYGSSSAALGFLALVSSAHSGPQTPLAAGRMGLEGQLPRLPACLLAPEPWQIGAED